MTSLSATAARKSFFDLVKGAAEGHRTYRIQHREGAAVLMSEEEYESIVETIQLLSIPGFRQSIKRSLKQAREGKTVPMKEVLGDA